MRKALIAVVVASALFAVGAFAASFTVQSEDIASGSNPVESCATSADVDFNEDFVEASNNWIIETVDVTLAGAEDCLGASVELVLQGNDANQTIVWQNTLVVTQAMVDAAGTDVVVQFDPATGDLTVGEVWNAAILIDGLNISST